MKIQRFSTNSYMVSVKRLELTFERTSSEKGKLFFDLKKNDSLVELRHAEIKILRVKITDWGKCGCTVKMY